jgi:hypothetical protein
MQDVAIGENWVKKMEKPEPFLKQLLNLSLFIQSEKLKIKKNVACGIA